jgi:hypothetical protein
MLAYSLKNVKPPHMLKRGFLLFTGNIKVAGKIILQ